MRIGIVEVGSRSIRLMVANFQFNGSFKADKTDSHIHGVAVQHLDEKAIANLWLEVDRLYSELRRFECDRVMVYGTALCRQIAERPGQKLPSYLYILSAEEEAIASWAAGFMCVPTQGESVTKQYTVIDQGAGSTELISANWTGKTAEKVTFDSIEIGNQKTMEIFSESRADYGKKIYDLVEELGTKISRHKAIRNSEIYLLGSVATKLAWLKVRKGLNDFYKPYLVNDVRLNVRSTIKQYSDILKEYRTNPAHARSLIDARPGVEDEFARVMSGTAFLMMASIKLGYQDVKVSGYGVRHGMAFLIRRGLI
jgi:exopolyphosphatase/pppGpp-phosphohydrolase